MVGSELKYKPGASYVPRTALNALPVLARWYLHFEETRDRDVMELSKVT